MNQFIFAIVLSLMFNTTVYSASKKIAILYDEMFLTHFTGENHPENAERLKTVISDLRMNNELLPYLLWPPIKDINKPILELVHDTNYIALVEKEVAAIRDGEISYLSTGDTVISKNSLTVAKKAVAAAITGVDGIMNDQYGSAFVLSRPPGHHATTSKGMGFCIFNQAAIAARYVQDKYNLKNILIVDFDVHHGNGTQDIFYDDATVFYFSVHQHPLYPQTGRPEEKGINNGLGYTLNVDMQKGAGDTEFLEVFAEKLLPVMDKFKPEFIIISAGFDSHSGDLLGGLEYTNKGYKQVAALLKNIAKKYAEGRHLYILEGGYVPENISRSTQAILSVMAE